MTTDEINKYIHEQIMGKCSVCQTGTRIGTPHMCIPFDNGIPDYCSDASPRSLLNEVCEKVGSVKNFAIYLNALNRQMEGHVNTFATAEQIARGCVEAHQTSSNPAKAGVSTETTQATEVK